MRYRRNRRRFAPRAPQAMAAAMNAAARNPAVEADINARIAAAHVAAAAKAAEAAKAATVVGSYATVEDFTAAAFNECVHMANVAERDRYLTGSDRAGWYGAGCETGRDVLNLLRKGWREGRERMSGLLDAIDTSNLVPVDTRRRLHRCDLGDAVDLSAIYAGRLETAWTRARRQTSIAPQRIEICANMLCSGGDDSDVLFWRGAAAVALADKMEAAGYMVRLVVGFGGVSTNGSERSSCRIIVKDHGAPLDIATASAVLLPGFFRAIGHGWAAGHCHNAGSSASMSVEQCIVEPGEIFLSHTVRDRETAEAWLRTQVDTFNKAAAA